MIWVVAAQTALACGDSVTGTGVSVLTEVRAQQGVWFQSGGPIAREDFTFTVEGAEADGELQTHTDPGTGTTYALFLPAPKLQEGRAYHIVTVDDDGAEVVQDGEVAATGTANAPRLSAVTIGDAVELTGDCGSGPAREILLDVSAGEGLVSFTDDAVGEIVLVTFIGGDAQSLVYTRPGRGAEKACMTPSSVVADGGVVKLASVCSDQSNVWNCSTAGGGGLGALAALGLLAAARVRRR